MRSYICRYTYILIIWKNTKAQKYQVRMPKSEQKKNIYENSERKSKWNRKSEVVCECG